MHHSSRKLIIAVIVLLISLVMVQLLWIYRAARMQEKQFEYTVVMALNKAATELMAQPEVCSQVTTCLMAKRQTSRAQNDIAQKQWAIIDSLISSELYLNKINIHYELQLSTLMHPDCKIGKRYRCFAVKSELITAQGESIWMHVTFPGRNAFIIAQMGGLFLLSLILILLTLFVFIRMYRNYQTELLISRDTRNFINNMTHELKTPLASIKLSNNRIRKSLTDNAQIATYTGIIEQESNKLDHLANYLLDASRLQRGHMPPNFEVIDINQLVTQQVEAFRFVVNEKEGTIQFQQNAEKTLVNGDSFQLSMALGNLIDNACKYSSGVPDINITTRNVNKNLCIDVTDKGIGIAPEDQKLIFNEFSRVDTGNLHQVKGFGLGLTFVWHIVQNHLGKLLLHSKKGEGSTFTIELPVNTNAVI